MCMCVCVRARVRAHVRFGTLEAFLVSALNVELDVQWVGV
jgi:hypothetical protein